MKNNNFLLVFFLGLGILLSSMTSFSVSAENATEETQIRAIIDRDIVVDPNAKNFDYAHKWFKEIFGEFIFAPWGGYDDQSVTLISKAIGFTNILALMLGIVIVYYVFIGGSINAAGKGEAMGQNWSGTWMPLRTLMGFGLIMPISKLGGGAVSLSQVFIIWLIMLGSNAASSLWTNIGLQITNQGVSITEPTILLNRSQITEIAKMVHCSRIQEIITNNEDAFVTFEYGSKNIVAPNYQAGIFSGRNITEVYNQAVYVGNDKREIVAEDTNLDASLSNISFGEGGKCGSFDFPSDVNPEHRGKVFGEDLRSNYKSDAINTGNNEARRQILEIMEEVAAIVSEIYKIKKIDGNLKNLQDVINIVNTQGLSELDGNQPQIYNDYLVLAKRFAIKADDYAINFIKNIHIKISTSGAIIEKFQNEMTYGGWGGAGMWFHEIGVLSSLSFKVANNFLSDSESTSTEVCTGVWDSYVWKRQECNLAEDNYGSGLSIADDMFRLTVAGDKHITEIDKVRLSCSGDSCSIDKDAGTRFSTDLGKTIIDILATSDSGMGNDTSVNPAIMSPFQAVTTIGNNMNSTAAIMYGSGMVITLLFETFDGSGLVGKVASKLPGPASIAGKFLRAGKKVFETWVMPLMAGLILSLITMGFTLAYVLPFLPIITWTLMVIGYLVTVIEALIAAPLAVILMVTPEGEGIAGTRLERAMQLIATAILRPSLMVIGLIASVTVGYVAFQIWNEFFFKTAEYVLTGSVFDFMAVVAIYTMTCFTICKQIIGIMHRLPNQILEWFSSGVGRSFGEDHAESGAEGATGQIKGLADQAGQSIGKSIGNNMRSKKSEGNDNQRNQRLMDALGK